jgi:hypothetical protein
VWSAIITVQVLNIDEPPTLANTTLYINENSVVSTNVPGALYPSDPDGPAVFNYTIIGGTGQVHAVGSS